MGLVWLIGSVSSLERSDPEESDQVLNQSIGLHSEVITVKDMTDRYIMEKTKKHLTVETILCHFCYCSVHESNCMCVYIHINLFKFWWVQKRLIPYILALEHHNIFP